MLARASDYRMYRDHYANYPMILIRLPQIDRPLLRELLTEAWRLVAPKGRSLTR